MKYLSCICLLPSVALALWPKPSSVEKGSGNKVLWISDKYEVKHRGAREVGSINYQNEQILYGGNDSDITPTGDEIVGFAIRQLNRLLFEQNIIPWKFHQRGWQEPSRDYATVISTLTLDQLKADPQNVAKPLAGDVDESYRLELPGDSNAIIQANSSIGLARGITTFSQLFFKHSQGGVYTTLAPTTISDAPKFSHRGLNLDVSRSWYAVEDIKRTIDAAAYNKLNRLHLHVTDSQSWPLQIPALPELAKKGAYLPELSYSPDDFAEIQYHAAIQGVELITEIDMPGHTSSIHYAYPELIAAFNQQPNWDTYAAEPPSGTLKLNSSAVDNFLKTLFDDLLPRVLPYSSYFHTGGDEVNKNAYKLDDTVKSNDTAVLQPLMQKFIDRNHDQVRAAGLTPIVWEEMLLDWNLTLGKDVVVQTWQSDAAVKNVVQKGYKALVGNYNYWYLDCGKGQWLNFDPSVSSTYWPYNDYCAPFHNWRLIYSYDPLSGIPADLQHLVLGGETHIWGEQTDPVNADRMIWPRAAAAAEILWSGAKDEKGGNRSQIEAAPRLSEMRERLVARGVGAEPIQMPFCTMTESGVPQCNLGTA